MKAELLFLVLAVIFVNFAHADKSRPAHSGTICDSQDKIFPGAKQSYSTLNELFNETASSAPLHIFGELHDLTDVQMKLQSFAELQSQMQGNQQCLFLEATSQNLTYYASEFSATGRDFNGFVAIIQFATSKGMKVIPIEYDYWKDIPKDALVPNPASPVGVALRNKGFAENIAHLLGNPCESAIMLIGKDHLARWPGKTLPDYLIQKKISFVTYNLSDHATRNEKDYDYWPCKMQISGVAGFSTKLLDSGVLAYPGLKKESGRYRSAFNYVILQP